MAISKQFTPHTELKAEDLNELISQTNDSIQAVSAQAAVNETDITGLKSKTDSISKQSTQSEEQAIIYETDGGVQVGKIDANGADFTNLKRGGQQVARMADLPTKDSSIGENPSTTNVPTTKAVKDYVDAHSGGDYPMEKSSTSASEDILQFVTDGGTVVGEVSPEGADFSNLSKGGKEVATLEDIPQSSLPIEQETVQVDSEEFLFANENTNVTYVRINEKGVFAKGLYEIADTSKAITNRGNLSVGGKLELEESHIHGSRRILFTADISSFTSCKIGVGTNKYWSSWLEIDGTSVVLKNYTNEVVNTGISWTHGLTFKDNLQITIEVDHQGNMTFDLVSGGHKYTGSRNIDDTLTTSVTTYFLGVNGKVFFEATNASLTNCVLSFTCDGWNKDIHVYGDSYLHTLNGKRPYYYLAKHGYTKSVLLNGFPGAGSLNAAPDLIRNLTHSRPKFIVWAMGMNDLDVDASTPSANWLSCVNTLLATCESLGIMPILCTIPSVIGGYSPDSGIGDMRIHKAKNDWVRNSGYRYIDFAKAVGASDVNGEWYNNGESDDFLESGSMRVHPSEYGALALYHQLIADFPEITNL